MKQISLTKNYCDNKVLIGKTIKDISFLNTDFAHDSQLLITFTDDTFIGLTIEGEDDKYNYPHFENYYPIPLNCYNGNVVGYTYTDFVTNQANFRYYPFISEQIRLGLIEDDKESVMQRIEEEKKRADKRDYEEYLRLKEKFEK